MVREQRLLLEETEVFRFAHIRLSRDGTFLRDKLDVVLRVVG